MKRSFWTVLLVLFGCAAFGAEQTGERFEALLNDPMVLLARGGAPATFFVSPQGDDSWSGRLAQPNQERTDGPWATLAAARDRVREYRASEAFDGQPTIVELAGGDYPIEEPVLFETADSGTEKAPILWRGAAGQRVHLSCGVPLSPGKKVTDERVLGKLKPEVRDHVVEIDLPAADTLDLRQPNGSAPELFFGGEAMTLARYPNEGFMKITDLLRDGTTEVTIHGRTGIREGRFYVDDPEAAEWADEDDVWLNGYWFWDWSNQIHKVERIDPKSLLIEITPPYHHYGYLAGQWFYAYNLLSELDLPGEYYIDRAARKLYFYPPEGEGEQGMFLTHANGALKVAEASYLGFAHLTVDGALGPGGAACSLRGDHLLAYDLEVCRSSGNAILAEGSYVTVMNCHLHRLGAMGVIVNGGDRKTLTPGNMAVVNNTIHHYGQVFRMYQSAVNLGGVGAYIARNLIYDAPHIGIHFGGNDHLFELNEIHHVCMESNDAGAVYAGRDPTMRGNLFRNNYLHDISGREGLGCVGVYLDDMFCSCDIVGNLFVRVTRAAMLGGGRDCHVLGNIFYDCNPALHIDARALGWCHDHTDGWVKESQEKGTMCGIAWNQPPYSERYPELAAILDGNIYAPEGNVVAGNICLGALDGREGAPGDGHWLDAVEEAARPYVRFGENLIGVDPGFVDPQKGDFRLKDETAAGAVGYEPIPFDQFGPRAL